MRSARGYAGLSKLRKTFKRMEPEVQRGITNKLKDSAIRIEKDAVGLAIMQDINLTGDLIHSITWKMGGDKSRVVIGPGADKTKWQKYPFGNPVEVKMGAMQKAARWNFTKGYWAEFGTKASAGKKAKLKKGGLRGMTKAVAPSRAQPARPFMNPAWDANKDQVRAVMRKAVNEALKRSAQ